MECECPIWIVGRTPTGDLVPRQSTGYSDIRQAEALRASFFTEAKKTAVHGLTIQECIEKYLASRLHELADKTHGQHELLLGRLKTFCNARGALYARELSVDILEDFKTYGLPALADTSKGTAVAKLRCFLRTAYRRGWITEPLVEKVTPHRAVYEQKEPYSDDEVNLILDEALNLSGGTHGYRLRHESSLRAVTPGKLASVIIATTEGYFALVANGEFEPCSN